VLKVVSERRLVVGHDRSTVRLTVAQVAIHTEIKGEET
jgi:hypothetical protein